jgi:DNA-binding response OmpR family regulator
VFTTEEFLNKLWSAESDSTEQAVRKCLTRLRKNIDGDDENGCLVTFKGMGYKLTGPKNK